MVGGKALAAVQDVGRSILQRRAAPEPRNTLFAACAAGIRFFCGKAIAVEVFSEPDWKIPVTKNDRAVGTTPTKAHSILCLFWPFENTVGCQKHDQNRLQRLERSTHRAAKCLSQAQTLVKVSGSLGSGATAIFEERKQTKAQLLGAFLFCSETHTQPQSKNGASTVKRNGPDAVSLWSTQLNTASLLVGADWFLDYCPLGRRACLEPAFKVPSTQRQSQA